MKLFIFSFLFCFVSTQFVYAADIIVLGLFKNKAMVEIDGKRRTLKIGKVSPEGVTLISADSEIAILDIAGEQKEFKLGRHIGANFKKKKQAEAKGRAIYASGYKKNGSKKKKKR